jgi:hypothetical protein
MPDYKAILVVIETGIEAESPFYAETCEDWRNCDAGKEGGGNANTKTG